MLQDRRKKARKTLLKENLLTKIILFSVLLYFLLSLPFFLSSEFDTFAVHILCVRFTRILVESERKIHLDDFTNTLRERVQH